MDWNCIAYVLDTERLIWGLLEALRINKNALEVEEWRLPIQEQPWELSSI